MSSCNLPALLPQCRGATDMHHCNEVLHRCKGSDTQFLYTANTKGPKSFRLPQWTMLKDTALTFLVLSFPLFLLLLQMHSFFQVEKSTITRKRPTSRTYNLLHKQFNFYLFTSWSTHSFGASLKLTVIVTFSLETILFHLKYPCYKLSGNYLPSKKIQRRFNKNKAPSIGQAGFESYAPDATP